MPNTSVKHITQIRSEIDQINQKLAPKFTLKQPTIKVDIPNRRFRAYTWLLNSQGENMSRDFHALYALYSALDVSIWGKTVLGFHTQPMGNQAKIIVLNIPFDPSEIT